MFTDTAFDTQIAAIMGEYADHNTPYIKASALVGISGVQKIVFWRNSKQLWGEDFYLTDTIEEAQEWLDTALNQEATNAGVYEFNHKGKTIFWLGYCRTAIKRINGIFMSMLNSKEIIRKYPPNHWLVINKVINTGFDTEIAGIISDHL